MIMLIARHNIIESSYDCWQVKTCPKSDVLIKHGEIQACWNIIENSALYKCLVNGADLDHIICVFMFYDLLKCFSFTLSLYYLGFF